MLIKSIKNASLSSFFACFFFMNNKKQTLAASVDKFIYRKNAV